MAFGITGKDVAKGEWKQIELPDPKAKVVYSASDFTGSYCHIVTEKGTVYFGGVNKKGESGESRKCIVKAWLWRSMGCPCCSRFVGGKHC